MNHELACKRISPETLVAEVRNLRRGSYRLVQISATRLPEEIELTYSFDKGLRVEHLRVTVPAGSAHLPSITSVFWCAFLYENELHDLFNVQVDGLAVDFHGSFYKTAVKFPFGSTKPPVTRPPATSKPPPAPPALGGDGAVPNRLQTNTLNPQ